jgi:superfamily II DNA/RNA helicase
VHSLTNRLQQSEYLAKYLRGHGFNAEAFHAGMQTAKKTELQEKFMANIRNIVHFDIPSSVEGYSQQIGRAGRDGKPSTCLFYLCPEDFYLRDIFTYGDLPSKNSLRYLLEDICSLGNVNANVGELITMDQNNQSRLFDIKVRYSNLRWCFAI